MIDEIRKIREASRTADDLLFGQQNGLRAREALLARARRAGEAGAGEAARLQREIAALSDQIARQRESLQSLRGQLSGLVDELVLTQSPRDLAAGLDDGLPCVLLPVRVETRFMGEPGSRELWLRVYPDDIAVHTHEEALTRDEAIAGIEYWTVIAGTADVADPEERERLAQGAWRALTNVSGGTRAAWIASDVERRALDRPENEDLTFLLIRPRLQVIVNDAQASPVEKRDAVVDLLSPPHPLHTAIRDEVIALLDADPAIGAETRVALQRAVDDGILRYLGFDPEELKPESWSRAPRSNVLPDRFVAIGITGEARQEWPFPTTIPSPLILGPDPQKLESELAQRDGDLVTGPDFAWIWDFQAALQVGMALRVPLPEPFASDGFDRLLVLGLHVSGEPADHSALLEELIDNHHYSPDGIAFLPQGTPTNNTARGSSGFSTSDAEGDDSFATEVQPPPLEPAAEDLEKSDAQRLAEAWDIRLGTLRSLRNATQQDVTRAKVMNQALWPATLGFYLEEALEIAPAAIDQVRRFFTADVTGRGSLPVLRVGKQPYGVLVTSSRGRWQIDDRIDGEEAAFLRRIHEVLTQVQLQWQQLTPQVSHVHAPGDSFAHLLNILGLHATSVDFQRRIGTYKTVLWNLAHLLIGGNFGGSDPIAQYFREVTSRGIDVSTQLGFQFPVLPRLFGLFFSNTTSDLNGPFVDDVATAEDEKLSETDPLPALYAVSLAEEAEEGATEETEEVVLRNYIGWLGASELDLLKRQQFRGADGTELPIPKPLLYRLLHRSLLLAFHDATIKLYQQAGLLEESIRREQDLTNVEEGRTVTRWEFMEARINQVLPEVSTADIAIGDFLATPDGLARPPAELLREVREAIARLENVPTAELERLTAEHIDLCSYRLDAWQTALFSRRLERLNFLRASGEGESPPKRGVHLGTYGWLEDLRPAAPPAVVPIEQIPEELREDGITVVEQAGNGGYIHGPSLNHAVAAAVLRNAYLTHADQQNAAHFSVQLTSERVRTALSFLEGVRNGQELGALLGYQFERALHDRYVIEGIALAQFILAFRAKYPLVADKVTPADAAEPIERKEAYHVVDGYALVEAAFLAEEPVGYPYGVEGLPTDPNNAARQAIVAEVERLRDTLDAISDLALAEGVFQVAQGNYDRAGAMLKAITEGNAPTEPEISRTPRGGAVVNHRIAVHFETGEVQSPWAVPPTPRSVAVPGLNRWLGERIGPLDSLEFSVEYDLDSSVSSVPLANLAIQPIDLVLLVGDEAGVMEGTEQRNDVTELESRIDLTYRTARKAADPEFDPSGRTTIRFQSRQGFTNPAARTFFELLPVLRNLRNLVTSSRALGADDYVLPTEQRTEPLPGTSAKRWDLEALEQQLVEAAGTLQDELDDLQDLLAAVPDGALATDPTQVPDLSGVDFEGLRNALVRLSLYGIPGAFPRRSLLTPPDPEPSPEEALALLRDRQVLIEQAMLTHALGTQRLAEAESLRTFADLSDEERNRLTGDEKADRFQRAAGLVLGDAFRLVPVFTVGNLDELNAARSFADAPPQQSLLRFTHDRLAAAAVGSSVQDWRSVAVEEWLQGVAAVRTRARALDALQTYQEAMDTEPLGLSPLQLPFDQRAHWIALEYPEVPFEQLDDPTQFVPTGDFLSIVRALPSGHDEAGDQSGLVLDEWTEVIPNRVETTGIAVHYDQPNTEPPQCVLVAVSPRMTGSWEWEDLVESVLDTLDRARSRAVEPDMLRITPYAQLLPAVLSTFTSFPFATISTNLAAQPASMVVERA